MSTFAPYVEERRERLRHVRVVAQLWAELWLRPEDEVLLGRRRAALAGLFTGYDQAPAQQFTSETASSLLGPLQAAGPVPLPV